MINGVKYVHTNLIARDWKKLARFYSEVFGCEPVLPERDLSGEPIDRLTGISGAHIRGIHLRLPGYTNGPTIEIFGYNSVADAGKPLVNRPGFGHIAFSVPDVEDALEKVIRSGGHAYGGLVEFDVPGAGKIKVIYATDPEGNIIELQNWLNTEEHFPP